MCPRRRRCSRSDGLTPHKMLAVLVQLEVLAVSSLHVVCEAPAPHEVLAVLVPLKALVALALLRCLRILCYLSS